MTQKKLEKLQLELSNQGRILMIMPSWIGDTVMALPTLEGVRKRYPHVCIEALARPWVAPLLRDHPALNGLMIWERKGLFRSMLRVAGMIRKRAYDLAVLMPNSFRTALLAFLGGARVRTGYSSNGRGWLLTHPLTRDHRACSLHMVEYYLEIVQAIGIQPEKSAPKLHVSQQKKDWAAQFFHNCGIEAHQVVVGILPGAQNSNAKMWLPARFAQLADSLVEKCDARVVFFGGAGDMERINQVREQMHGPSVNLAGKVPLESLAAAIERCNVFVSNDTGPMHVASAVGIPVVAIFGPTDPRITAPGGGPCTIVQASVPCAPCGKRNCDRKMECMQEISTEKVFRAVEWHMKARRQ